MEGQGIDDQSQIIGKRATDKRNPIPRDDILVLDRVKATDGPLHEVLPKLKERFIPWWGAQFARMKREGVEPVMDIDEAFAQETKFLSLVTNRVGQLMDESFGRPVIILFDVDETVGRVPETEKHIKVPGFEDVDEDELGDEQKKQLRQLREEYAYRGLQLRPGLEITTKYLKDTYGDKVQFGMLTTKSQKGMDDYISPQLNPRIFERELIMSCTDGAAETLIPDVLAMTRGASEQRIRLSFKQVMDKFAESLPPDSTVIPERMVSGNEGIFTEYDLKLLVMIRLLEQLRREGHNQMHDDLDSMPEDAHEDWLHNTQPESVILLVDDSEQEGLLPHDSLKSLTVPRFRLPDDEY